MNKRITMMCEKLAVLNPLVLHITDESHKHVGHAGARSGGGHFCLQITSVSFSGNSKMHRHRMIYSALAEMMERDIHALVIDAKAPGEVE